MIVPAIVARLQSASPVAREVELIRIGLAHLRRTVGFALDGRDCDRALDIATVAYDEAVGGVS